MISFSWHPQSYLSCDQEETSRNAFVSVTLLIYFCLQIWFAKIFKLLRIFLFFLSFPLDVTEQTYHSYIGICIASTVSDRYCVKKPLLAIKWIKYQCWAATGRADVTILSVNSAHQQELCEKLAVSSPSLINRTLISTLINTSTTSRQSKHPVV